MDETTGPGAGWLTRRRELGLLALILLVALVARVVLVLQLRESPLFDDPQLDARFFVDWGRSVAHGTLVPDGPFERAPLYAWFLGAIFRVFGDGLLAPRLVQALIGTASVALTAWLARELFSPRVGLVAALLLALCWPLAWYDADLVRESLMIALSLSALALVVRAIRKPSNLAWIAVGIAFGLAALVRPQVLVPVAAVLVWALVTRRVDVRRALIAAGALVIVLAPITLHNMRAGGGFVPVSTEAGLSLWIGNNPLADGVTSIAPGLRRGFDEQMVDARAIAEREAGHPLSESEVSRHLANKAIDWVNAHPGDALRLYGRKALLLVSGFELGSNPDEPEFLSERFAPITRFMPVSFGLLLALGLAGLVVGLRPAGERGLLAVYLVAYAVTVMLVQVSARHRIPLVPILALFAAAGAVRLWDEFRARRDSRTTSVVRAPAEPCQAPVARVRATGARHGQRRSSLREAILLCVCALAGFGLTRAYPWPADASRANGLTWLGMSAGRAGDAAGALKLLDDALTLRPDSADIQRARGAVLAKLQRPEDSHLAFAEAARFAPDDVEALDAFGDAEIRAGHHASARDLADRAIAIAPHMARSWTLRGRARYYLGDLKGAASDFREALARDPRSFIAAYSLGAALQDLGATDEAIHAFEQAVAASGGTEDAPFARSAFERLIGLLRAAGREDEARAWTDRAVKRFGPAFR